MGSNGERSAQPAILSAAEVASWLPFTALPAPGQRKTRLRQQLLDSGCSTPAQAGGRRWATGCVSFEITQRCNLLQAATGRGVLHERDQIISADTTITQIRLGTGAHLDFDALAVGHPHCNRYALSLVVGDTVHDVNVDRTLTAKVLTHLGDTSFPRTHRRAARKAIAALLCRHPDLWWPTLKALAGFAWRARRDLVAARGRVHKLSFFVHNFMDAQHIERERAHACVFMVATARPALDVRAQRQARQLRVRVTRSCHAPRCGTLGSTTSTSR